eukprot:TRINITY_DN5386_c0_g1_i1.p1 TRINITY_DN5386_c0_g1~~TRINITY_DN5386_c0_g1_i1.p1  ORF type:complete len:348 (+),score=76.74 TRINITY_DN5386_c0_g1_i1:23-1045(+)
MDLLFNATDNNEECEDPNAVAAIAESLFKETESKPSITPSTQNYQNVYTSTPSLPPASNSLITPNLPPSSNIPNNGPSEHIYKPSNNNVNMANQNPNANVLLGLTKEQINKVNEIFTQFQHSKISQEDLKIGLERVMGKETFELFIKQRQRQQLEQQRQAIALQTQQAQQLMKMKMQNLTPQPVGISVPGAGTSYGLMGSPRPGYTYINPQQTLLPAGLNPLNSPSSSLPKGFNQYSNMPRPPILGSTSTHNSDPNLLRRTMKQPGTNLDEPPNKKARPALNIPAGSAPSFLGDKKVAEDDEIDDDPAGNVSIKELNDVTLLAGVNLKVNLVLAYDIYLF